MKTKFIPERSQGVPVIDIERALEILSRSIKLKGGGDAMANETQVILDDVETAQESSQPVFKAKVGAFQTAVFLNETNGRTVPSVQLEKSVTNGQGWRHYKMTLLSSKEIDKLICVLQDTKRALYDHFE